MMKSIWLQMPILGRLRLNYLSPNGRSPASLRPPQVKPRVPRRILLHHDTSYSLISPSIQPLAGHIQNTSNTLLEPRVPVVVTVPVVSTSMPQRETPEPLLAHPRSRLHLVSSPPVVRLHPLSPRRLGQSSYLPLATLRLTTTPRSGTLYSQRWIWSSRPSCSTHFLDPADGTRRRVILLERV